MIERLVEFFWGRVPLVAARASLALGFVLRDGGYLESLPPVAAIAPPAAIVIGFLFGWRHPLATDLYTTSLLIMSVALIIGTLSAAVGAWLVLGYALGDLVLAVRDPLYTSGFASAGKTWLALLLCDVILLMLVVLIPLTSRALAGEVAMRWRLPRPELSTHAVAVFAEVLMVFAWTQAALVLTRPYFAWHAVAPTATAVNALHIAGWLLPLVALGAGAARAYLEIRFAAGIPQRPAFAARSRRPLPVAVSVAWRVAIAVFILAGLMESWIDAVVVAIVMAVFIVLREPALRRFDAGASYVMRFPILPRLIAGAVVSAIIAIIIVSIFGTESVVRPIVISTLVSLIVFTLLLPDHVLGEHGHEHVHEPTHDPLAPPAPPPPAAPAPVAQ